MKLTTKILGVFTISGAVGLTTYFLVKNNEDSDYVKPNYSQKIGSFEITLEEFGDYLGTDGMNKLKTKIEKQLPFGPEIFMLKKIVLGNDNITQPNENGVYYGATNEIYINTNNMNIEISKNISPEMKSIKIQNIKGQVVDYVNEREYLDAKVELVFQTLYHEYLHHLAYAYINSVKSDSNDATKIWVANENAQVEESWNKNFIDQFKNILQYNSKNITHNPSLKYNQEGLEVEPISNLYSLSDLWNKANDKWVNNDDNVYSELTFDEKNYSFIHSTASSEDKVITPFNKNFVKKDAKNKELSYLYSSAELFVRKYMQALYQFPTSSPKPFGQVSYPWYINKDTQGTILKYVRNQSGQGVLWPTYFSTFLIDVLHYQDTMDSRAAYVHRFYDDAPFATSGQDTNGTARNMYDLLSKQTGYDIGADISLIWSKNDSKLKDAKSYIPDGNKNLIRFGGYIPNPQLNYVGYFENEIDKTNFVSFAIVSNPYNIKYKSQLLAQNIEQLNATKENDFYVTQDWIPYEKIINKNLYFATKQDQDKNFSNITPLEKIRNSSSMVSTYYSQLNSNFYEPIQALTINNHVQISKGGY